MKAALMSHLGFNDQQATQAIAGLRAEVLHDLIRFVTEYGVEAKGAVLATLPFILRGDTAGAVKAEFMYFMSLLTAPKAPETPPDPPAPIVTETPKLDPNPTEPERPKQQQQWQKSGKR